MADYIEPFAGAILSDPPFVDRDESVIECSCGGAARRVKCSKAERDRWGCGRDSANWECCARAFVCKVCGKRYAGNAYAPDMD